jgi:hypothetical protein
MGARALVLSCVGGVAILVGTALAAGPATAPGQRTCGDRAVTILFWPKGHGVIRALGFPESKKPHLELYRYAGAQTYLPANAIGFAEAGGPYKLLAPRCKAQAVTTKLTYAPWKTRTDKLIATCSFPSGATVQTLKIGTAGWDVKLLDGSRKVVLRAQIKPAASTLSATQQCSIGRAPS